MSEKKAGPKNTFGHPMVKVVGGQYVESAVYDKATGARLLRFPIDAKEMVASGAYSYEPVTVAPEASEPEADAPVEPDNDPPRRGPGRPRKAA